MICPKCNGKGTVGYYHIDHFVDVECDRCHGSGEVEMTNEEWIKSANTEQLAEFIVDAIVFYDGNRHAFVTEALEVAKKKNVNLACDSIYESVVEWLKQPHTVKE